MKAVSNAYKASMKSMLRNRSYVEISFGNVDATAATDGNWSSNGEQSYSEFDTLDYNYEYRKVLCGSGTESLGFGRKHGHCTLFRHDV